MNSANTEKSHICLRCDKPVHYVSAKGWTHNRKSGLHHFIEPIDVNDTDGTPYGALHTWVARKIAKTHAQPDDVSLPIETAADLIVGMMADREVAAQLEGQKAEKL